MKITKSQLRKIIKEEVQHVLSERFAPESPNLRGDQSLSKLTHFNDPEKSNLHKLPPGEKPTEKTVGYKHGYPETVEWNSQLTRWDTRLGQPLLDSEGKPRRPTHDEMDKTRGVEKKVSSAQAKKPSSYSLQGMGRPGGKGEINDPARARTHAIDRKRYKHGAGWNKMKVTMAQLRTMVQEQIKQMTEADDSFSKAGEEIEKKGTEGVFTAKAKKRGMTAQEFARKVLANTDEYDLKTVRQASFAKGAKTVADKKW
jgi:hypothetical protein